MLKIIVGCAILTFLFGCATAPVSSKAAEVRIEKIAPSGCKNLGDVSGDSGYWSTSVKNSLEAARNDIRNKASALGANVVVLETNNQIGARVTLGGQAYSCPE